MKWKDLSRKCRKKIPRVSIFSLTSDTFTADLVGTEAVKLEDIEALDLVTDLANRANLLRPGLKQRELDTIIRIQRQWWSRMCRYATYAPNIFRLVLDGLLEGGDVPEGAEEEHHHVALILDRRNVHQKPERSSCNPAANVKSTNISLSMLCFWFYLNNHSWS